MRLGDGSSRARRGLLLSDRSSSRTTGSISSVESTREAEARRRVEQARVARLATVDARGRPHVVPICFVLRATFLLVADRKPALAAAEALDNIRANPNVTAVDHYEEDWSRLWWCASAAAVACSRPARSANVLSRCSPTSTRSTAPNPC